MKCCRWEGEGGEREGTLVKQESCVGAFPQHRKPQETGRRMPSVCKMSSFRAYWDMSAAGHGLELMRKIWTRNLTLKSAALREELNPTAMDEMVPERRGAEWARGEP